MIYDTPIRSIINASAGSVKQEKAENNQQKISLMNRVRGPEIRYLEQPAIFAVELDNSSKSLPSNRKEK